MTALQCIYSIVSMGTAKLFKHGGSQAVRLPKNCRFKGSEVLIEKQGDAVVLRPKPEISTLADLARHMREHFPDIDFPDREQKKKQQKRKPFD